MPSSEGISTKVSVLGDKEYKKALQDIGRRLTMLNTEMAATSSAFGDQADSMEAMRAKASSLQSVYDAHAEKVKLIAEQLNRAKVVYGENSKEADNLQIALNRAANAMNKVGNEIKKNDAAMDKLAAETEAAAAARDAHRSHDRPFAAHVGVRVRGAQGGCGRRRLRPAAQSAGPELLRRRRGTHLVHRPGRRQQAVRFVSAIG